MSAQIKNS